MPYDVRIDRLPLFALYDIKGSTEILRDWAGQILPEFPTPPNTMTRGANMDFCHVGPERWLLRGPLAAESNLGAALRPDDAPPEISLVRISDAMTFFRITGPDAGEVMSIGCPLDLHPLVFGPDAVSFTEFFGLRALVLRCDNGFDCAVEQSFGDMISEFLARATA